MRLMEGEDFDWIPFNKISKYDLTEKSKRDLEKFLSKIKI